jgi:hypothetical protein
VQPENSEDPLLVEAEQLSEKMQLQHLSIVGTTFNLSFFGSRILTIFHSTGVREL